MEDEAALRQQQADALERLRGIKEVMGIIYSFLPDLDRFRLGVVDQTFRNDKGRGTFVGGYGWYGIYNLLEAFRMIKEHKDYMDNPEHLQEFLEREDYDFQGEVKSSWFTEEHGYDMELVKVRRLLPRCIVGVISAILCSPTLTIPFLL
jgi:hypothetical protein